MRQLTVSQKKLLNIEAKKGVSDVEELSSEVWEKLQEINDTEILYQEVDRYLNDRVFEEENRRPAWYR